MKKTILLQICLVVGLLVLTSGTGVALEVAAEAGFTDQQAAELEVKASFCDVEVIGKQQSGVDFKGKIVEKGLRLGSDYQIKYHNQDGQLTVWVAGGSSGFGIGTVKGKLKFFVPQDLLVTVRTDSGDVDLSALSQQAVVDTSSGDIKVSNHQSDLRLDSSAGDMQITDLTGDLVSSSSSGDQLYQQSTGRLQVETSSGDIELEQVTGQLNLETSSGDIQGSAVLLNQASDVETSSGDVAIDIENELSELSFDLQSSSGRLRVGQTVSEERLMIDRGSIMINGESSSGDQEYY